MRLKTKLVTAATGVTFAIVAGLSLLFLGELLRQRVAQTSASTDVMALQAVMMTGQAVQVGLTVHPPANASEDAFSAAVDDSLRHYGPLVDTMRSFVLYSPAVQDVSVTDVHGTVLVSTDKEMIGQQLPLRMSFARLRGAGVTFQARQVFGAAQVLDNSLMLERNHKPFLLVHVGVRSTFLKANYEPRLKDGLLLALVCALISMTAAAVLTNVALRPMELVEMRLAKLREATAGTISMEANAALPERYIPRLEAGGKDRGDTVVRVSNTIDQLGEQIKTTEAVYTDLQTNLNQMLDTLRDGVVLFSAQGHAVMVSDAVEHFIHHDGKPLMGKTLSEIFPPETALGYEVAAAFKERENVEARPVRLEDGREVEIALDWISEGSRKSGSMGTLLTLRDRGSAMKLERELEVSRRLAAVGKLTAGVGHEVKNPINAMVVHLELLRSKLQVAGEGRSFLAGAQRHVDILAGEMTRLDRVVQTLTDFTRPMELKLQDLNLCDIAGAVVELTSGEMEERKVQFHCNMPQAVKVLADGELLRQAMLNLVLNGMQAMSGEGGKGGVLTIDVHREWRFPTRGRGFHRI
jgi:nitrogen-specific signal transduction histidine kinase